MKRVLAIAALCAVSGGVAAETNVPADNYIGILGDYDFHPGRARTPHIDDGAGFELILGSRTHPDPMGLTGELRVFWDQLDPKSGGIGNRHQDGVAADLLKLHGDWGPVSPFSLMGVGVAQSNAVPDLKTHFGWLGELGGGLISHAINDWGWRARAELKFEIEKFPGDANPYRDWHALAGLEIPLSHPHAAAPAPKPAPAPAPKAAPTPEPKAEPAPAPAPKKEEFKKVLALKGVNFQTNSDKLTAGSLPILDNAAKTLNTEFTDAKVEVAGHTDDKGNADYNKALSKKRAEAVRQYLIGKGVKGDRLTSEGYGSAQPVGDNKTREGRAKNRRVELRVK